MKVSGPADNQLRFPRFDIGDDGVLDWYYLGDLEGFKQEFVKPENLNDELQGSDVFINDNKTLLCQKIDLPLGRHFDVYAKHKKVGTKGDLKAVILAPNEGNFRFLTGGDENCDMQESNEFEYNHCLDPIELTYAAKGEHLVCVFNGGGYEVDSEGNAIQGSNEYVLKSDKSEPSTTSYRCVSEIEGDYECTPVTTNNFFIKVKPAKYTEKLNKEAVFENFELGPNAVLNSFRKFVGSNDDEVNPFNNFPGLCNEPQCLIPIRIYANGTGTVTISDLDIRYFYEIEQAEDMLYDVEKAPPMIDSINGKDLESEEVVIEIPLKLFDARVPELPISSIKKFDVSVEVQFEDGEDKAKLEAYRDAIPLEGVAAAINETEYYVSQVLAQDQDALTLLTLLELKDKLDSAQSELLALDTKADDVEHKLSTITAVLVKEVVLQNSVVDTQIFTLDDIPSSILGTYDVEDVYQSQANVHVSFAVKNYKVLTFDGEEKNYALVRKTIRPSVTLDKVNIYEVVPKSVASTLSQIHFAETPDVVESDPIVKWFVSKLMKNAQKEIVYAVETYSQVYDQTKTILVEEKQEEEESVVEDECGDEVCGDTEDEESCPEDCAEPSNATFVIVVVVIVLVLAVGFVLAKTGVIVLPGMKPKSPFKDEKQKDAVVKFVRKAKSSGKSDDQIRKMLLGKGWTNQHVDFVFAEIKKNPVNPALVNYVVAARKKGFSEQQIRQNLLRQGWMKIQ
jgi:hypothetical protein